MPFVPDSIAPKKGFTPDKKTLQGFIGNVGKSGINLATGIGSAALNVLNPDLEKNTVVNLGKTILDTGGAIGNALTGTEVPKENKFRQLADFYKTRYGGIKNIGNTLYNDPLGVAMDVSAVAGGAGALAKLGGLGRTANVFSKISEVTNPISAVGKVAGMGKGALQKAISKTGEGLTAESENILTRGMGNPMKLKEAKAVSPISMNQLFEKYNTYERTPEAFGAAAKEGSKVRSGMIAEAGQAGTKVDVLNILEKWNAEIKRLAEKANEGSEGALQQLMELKKRRDTFLNSIGAKTEGYTPLKVDPAKVDRIRANFEGDMPQNAFAAPQSELNKASGIRAGYRGLLGGLEEATPGIKTVGREISALKKLEKIATNQESRAAARQNLNFTKMGGAGIGGVLGGIKGAVTGFVAEQIANHPRTLGVTSKVLEKSGKALSGVKLPSTKMPMGAIQTLRVSSNIQPKRVRKFRGVGGYRSK